MPEFWFSLSLGGYSSVRRYRFVRGQHRQRGGGTYYLYLFSDLLIDLLIDMFEYQFRYSPSTVFGTPRVPFLVLTQYRFWDSLIWDSQFRYPRFWVNRSVCKGWRCDRFSARR